MSKDHPAAAFRNPHDLAAIVAAGHDMLRCILAAYRDAQGVHAPTAIGALAALAGECALYAGMKKNGGRLPAHARWVPSCGHTDNLLGQAQEGLTVWLLIEAGALKVGAAPADLPAFADVVRRMKGAAGRSPYPPLTIPRAHHPREWSPGACPRHRARIAEIGRGHGLNDPDAVALALGFALHVLIQRAKDAIPPAHAARLAAELMVGVSRMAPLR